MKRLNIKLLLSALLLTLASANQSQASWVYQREGELYNEEGTQVRFTGVNWFGLETSNRLFHGLWGRDYRGMLRQIHDLGFNCVRIPYSNAILVPGAMPTSLNIWGPDRMALR